MHALSLPIQLSLYDVVLFIDDSGSMLEGSKWRDIQAISQQIVEMTTKFDTDGIQVTRCMIPHRNNLENWPHRHFMALCSHAPPPDSVSISLTRRLQVEFMNSTARADNVSSPAAVEQLFSHVRPMGFTPLASALESKVLEPYYEKLRTTPAANVKPIVIYICTDGAPTTERGLKTYQPTFNMLAKVIRSFLHQPLSVSPTSIILPDGFHIEEPRFSTQDNRHQRDANRS